MNVLISGGSGLIGQALSASLISDGHQVTVLTRNPEKMRSKLPSEVIAQKWDAGTPEGWGHLIEETDAVVNLAGESIGGETLVDIFTRHWTPAQKKRILESRENTGAAITAAIAAATRKPDVLVQASAVGFYGQRGAEEITESTNSGNDFLSQVCQQWENSTLKVEEIGVRRIIIRTGLVLSKKGGILPVMLLPFKLFAGGPIGNGQQFISWINMEDEIRAIRFLMENEAASGVFNLTAPNPVNYQEFAKIAGRIMKRPGLIPTPGFALKLVLGEKSTLVLDGQRVLPARLKELGFNFENEKLEKTLKTLLEK